MNKHVILITVIILVCACAVGLVALAMNSDEPNEGASDAGDVSDIVTDPTDEITEPITDKPTEPATEAPTEPVTEAPTEPATEPETVPPTQPKVDFTYFARDTMLDGSTVDFYSGACFEQLTPDDGIIDNEFMIECDVHETTEKDLIVTPRIGIIVINTYEEYIGYCEKYYDMIKEVNLRYSKKLVDYPKSWERFYDSYDQIPQYQAYDRDFFIYNDLIISNTYHASSPLGFHNITKNGAELCISVGIGLRREGLIFPTVVPKGGARCYEISKSDMDGIDTISLYVKKTGNI